MLTSPPDHSSAFVALYVLLPGAIVVYSLIRIRTSKVPGFATILPWICTVALALSTAVNSVFLFGGDQFFLALENRIPWLPMTGIALVLVLLTSTAASTALVGSITSFIRRTEGWWGATFMVLAVGCSLQALAWLAWLIGG